jgi:hypothetical protein
VYRWTLVGTRGRERAKRTEGILRLRRRSAGETVRDFSGRLVDISRQQPYLGTAQIDLAAVGAGVEGRLDTESPAPGVVLAVERAEDTHRSELHLELGSEQNRYDSAILDGNYTEVLIRSVSPSGSAGTWDAFGGPTTYHVGGYFWAARQEPA